MESPQMYDNVQSINQLDIKKGTMATNNINNNNNHSVVNNNNNNNNNTASAINHNTMAANKTTHQMLQANNTNNNNNTILQKHILQQYSQSDLEELTSQEISLDLQHLIDDQFREQEALGIFSDMEPNSNNNNNTHNNNNTNGNNANNGTLSAAAKVLQHQNRVNQQQSQGYQRATLAYMPQPVHSGANYANTSSDDNSSIGSDGTNIKEEPVDSRGLDSAEFRRLAAAANGAQFIGVNQEAGGLYQIPQNYPSNGSGTFTTLTAPVLHHQGLPHLPGSHLASLKHKQLMSHRKHQNKHVDKGTDEYRRRRERNNIAVRKSREKAKVRSREVEEKVKALVKEKEALMRRLEEMTNEIQLHKQLYVHLMNHNNPEVNNICRNVLSLVSGDHGM